MYLDNSSIEEASGVYPIDDDDYASASGSGKASYLHIISVLRVYVCTRAHTHTLTHTYTHTLLERASGQQAGGIIVKGTLCGVTVPGCEF